MNIDERALSGALFAPPSRPSSPARSPSCSRSPSPDALWPASPASSVSDRGAAPAPAAAAGAPGVKGVIRDRNAAVRRAQAQRAHDIAAANRRMEQAALSARTYAEDVRGGGGFGHVREVGAAGFVDAVEGAAWAVVHIYEPGLPRCRDLDAALARLAHEHPQTGFLRARARALGFAALPDDGEGGEDEDDEGGGTDTEMLPTVLAYRGGELVHTWVRADWAWAAAGAGGLAGLLQGHGVLEPRGRANCGLPSDDDDDDDIGDLDLEFASGSAGSDGDNASGGD